MDASDPPGTSRLVMPPEQREPAPGSIPPHLDPARTPELIAEDSTLHALIRGIASASGDECFRVITRSLAQTLGVKYAIIAEFLPETKSVRSLAFWNGEGFAANVGWALAGTPCQGVIDGN